MGIKLDQFLNMLEESLQLLVEHENELIDRRINEVCINHKFANYLEIVFRRSNYSWVTVDLEYDKNYDQRKIITTDTGNKYIRPDILIHKREDNNNNLIAFECKKSYLNRNDHIKLISLLNKPYYYSFTCAISYLPEKKHMFIRVFCKDEILDLRFNKADKKLKEVKRVPSQSSVPLEKIFKNIPDKEEFQKIPRIFQ